MQYIQSPTSVSCVVRTGWFGCKIQRAPGHPGHGVLHVNDGDRRHLGRGPGAGHPPGEPQAEGQSRPRKEERRGVQRGRSLRSHPKSLPGELGAGVFSTGRSLPRGLFTHHESSDSRSSFSNRLLFSLLVMQIQTVTTKVPVPTNRTKAPPQFTVKRSLQFKGGMNVLGR